MALEINEKLSEEELDSIFEKFDPENQQRCSFMAFYKCMQEVVQKKYH